MAMPEMEKFVDRILTWMEHLIKTSSALELAVSRLVYLCPDVPMILAVSRLVYLCPDVPMILAVSRLVYLCPDVSNDPGCIQVSISLS